MQTEELAREREAIIAQYGHWSAQNIHLGEGVYTIGKGHVHAAERRVARTVQLIADIAGVPLSELRILDLGAYECAFAIELAAQGAQVTAVEVREPHAIKGEFARRALGLENLTIVQGDIRDFDSLVTGEFDVVLCLGLIYHLGAEDALALLKQIAARTRRFALVEGQISLSRSESVAIDGTEYHGRLYPENESDPGSGVAVSDAFWFTRRSLLRALGTAGFRSVAEVHLPFIPEVVVFEDHVTMLAIKGEPVPLRAVPEDPAWSKERMPERWSPLAHPTQGVRYRLRERIARMRGGGMAAIFPSAVPEDDRGS
jgi:hypothetical protein